ncbi:hypothetical protein GWI33_011427 [Rhynchophorus ferrugineus]|uniref:Uncharacterized protein n=1 Tax=Rhynchophorus ferrugineus TaxID=354439 RepID=A0A834MIR5_RHYFE|nr:hypothetical protein GWI33_011427 [Rhynchophorus ferrugineus]
MEIPPFVLPVLLLFIERRGRGRPGWRIDCFSSPPFPWKNYSDPAELFPVVGSFCFQFATEGDAPKKVSNFNSRPFRFVAHQRTQKIACNQNIGTPQKPRTMEEHIFT